MSDSETIADNAETIDDFVESAMAEKGILESDDATELRPKERRQTLSKDAKRGKDFGYDDDKPEAYEKDNGKKNYQRETNGYVKHANNLTARLASDTINTNSLNEKSDFSAALAEGSLHASFFGSALESAVQNSEDNETEIKDAALVVIHYQDPITGENIGLFELTPFWYPYAGQGNRLKLIGGHIEHGETAYIALLREIDEEISERAAGIIKKHIDPNPRFTAIEYIDGIPIRNIVFEAKIPTGSEWGKVESGHMTADAGYKATIPLEHIAETKGRWAFYHYDMSNKFIRDYLHKDTGWKRSTNIEFKESWAMLQSLNLPGIYDGNAKVLFNPMAATEFKSVPYGQLKYAA